MTDYELIISRAEELAKDSLWDITLYANISALIYDSFEDLNWAGFYLMRDGRLHLGPFQGKVACTVIPVGKGVCGTAVERGEVIPNPR